MPSTIKDKLDQIRKLIAEGHPSDKGIPINKFQEYLDPEDRFYNQIIGGKNGNK